MRHGRWLSEDARTRAAGAVFNSRVTANMIAAALAAVVLAAGCAAQRPTTAASSAPPPPPDAPHVITSLSQLSSSETDLASLNAAAKVLRSDQSRNPEAASQEHRDLGADRPSLLRRLYLEDPESPHYAETSIAHAEERLLNAKAADYPGFADMMLAQLLSAMTRNEKMPPLVRLELSEPVKPVILTAVLDDRGQLKELIYRQHSGLAVIDNFVIAACKASLWANNMPKGAMFEDGGYRLRIEAEISKYSTDRHGNQTFVTRVGLGIL